MGSKVKLGSLLSLLTDYHANGAYKKLKENVELFDEPDYAVMIRTTNFEQKNFDSNLKYISEHAYNFLEKSKVKAGDIIMNKIANAGSSYLMPELNCPVSLAMNLFLLRIDDDKANSTFVYLYLKLNEDYVKSFANGSVTKTITKEVVRNLEIELPERSIQDYIVKVYMDYVSKLTLNQKTNQTLEQMAQALFKSWFVDFDPVFDNLLASVDFNLENLETSLPDELKLKAQRRLVALNSLENVAQYKASLIALAHELQALSPTKEATQSAEKGTETPVKANFNTNPNILAQHANTHAHFPNEFEHNEQLGWIPKGWEDVKVNEMVRTVSETYPLKSVGKVIFLNTGDILEGKFLHSEFSNTEGLPGQAKKSIKKGDILYSEIRPKNKRFALVNFDGSEHVVSTKLMVLRPNEGFEELFPYFVLTQEHNISLLQQAAESRSGTFPQITFTELAMIKIALPKDKKLINIFISSFLKDHFSKKDKRDFQNKTLTKLRDTLLPKLISGELQIPDLATDDETAD
ncbi:restriction endonuclease subunit S [Pseudoalteromonas sp. NEC-BIFX-2020_002]|uniref:restriction endonuclease subunit S n=1 Tax=Pseudoalteromonas sp. NEC-BIFX-2020_002 TaxID=2732353 RepID=UPI0014776B2F|nr:restriction endonuclease subunit S [Pseudoalteromonas sp. NEC-BIFX-2020_002]NNG43313.1 restriction endonuclease subunit S [Pseudoalteromonas sp. NEC-BIFX-2020_002]